MMTITLTITSLAQLRAVEAALELYVGCEGERVKCGPEEFKDTAEHEQVRRQVAAGAKLLQQLTEGR